MTVLIGLGGLIGTGMLAYALFGMEFVFPRWKRWAVGLIGAGLAVTFWIVRPCGGTTMGATLSKTAGMVAAIRVRSWYGS